MMKKQQTIKINKNENCCWKRNMNIKLIKINKSCGSF